MHRPVRFEHTRYLGDKRTQLVYDLDEWDDEEVIDGIIAAETGLCFGPDGSAHLRLSQWMARTVEASPGVEPEVTRFADGALRRERREAVDPVRERTGVSVPLTGFEPAASTFGTSRSFR